MQHNFPISLSRLRPALAVLCLGVLSPALGQDAPPVDAASIERGAQLFQQHCTACHGHDGRAQVDVIADATDLTAPAYYYNGSTDQELFTSIADGAGVAMPGWRGPLGGDAPVWDLVYFVKTLWAQ